MAPHRHHKSRAEEPQAGPSRPRPKPLEQRDGSGVPGLSKLKASIRQTKRLLAKDTLEPGFKIATQRRLASLQADLAKAELREVEKKNGGKYHMVKFFERQKATRLIKKYKRLLQNESEEERRAQLEQELEECRVMLNYVLHYPYDQKYISLFPPQAEPQDKLVLPMLFPSDPNFDSMEKGDRKRLQILLKTRDMMRAGELSLEPENEKQKRAGGVTIAEDRQDKEARATKRVELETKRDETGDDFFEQE
ncbi:hypothetical protein BD324DRAFT_625387 [Kockovaella imperatae]|uniref:rRNA-processing protein EFG1 n=1 Tax=Kockovaella imperatae TaxID=4999 RepID=A0A1Y1UGQ4_9TREE|nr:hypothetical protein BD324DRAFT_625387 [Kockovaella imperatae]ORX37241.1 hypothetical protein BD324DRAFT_625387 [Kockovaella imperatae]